MSLRRNNSNALSIRLTAVGKRTYTSERETVNLKRDILLFMIRTCARKQLLWWWFSFKRKDHCTVYFPLVQVQHGNEQFLHPSLLHSFTLNSKLAFSVNPFHHRSLTIDTRDWLSPLMGPFSVSLLCSAVLVSWFCVVRLN